MKDEAKKYGKLAPIMTPAKPLDASFLLRLVSQSWRRRNTFGNTRNPRAVVQLPNQGMATVQHWCSVLSLFTMAQFSSGRAWAGRSMAGSESSSACCPTIWAGSYPRDREPALISLQQRLQEPIHRTLGTSARARRPRQSTSALIPSRIQSTPNVPPPWMRAHACEGALAIAVQCSAKYDLVRIAL
jgi:hypothetical protein